MPIHWNQSQKVKTTVLKWVITKSEIPDIKVHKVTPLYIFCFKCTRPGLFLLCYRLKEQEELYRKVINKFENNNQSLVRENIKLRDSYCKLHANLGSLTQQFTVLAVSPSH
jgi:hypothetical protein